MGIENLAIFAGNANPKLAQEVARHLSSSLGKVLVNSFSDGEVNIEILENVRGQDIYVIQPTCAPAEKNLMELLVMIDALKRSSADRVTAVLPYFGYARQDRRPRTARVAITAKLVADMICVAGADRALTMDLHADQIQGFFNIPVDNIYASPVLNSELYRHEPENLLVVSPDVGGVVRARAMAVLQSRLLEAEIRQQKSEVAATRRSLVGTGDRSERIRTYNFPQGRVTDHRINLTLYKLDQILTGDLAQVIEPLVVEHQAEELAVLALG